MLFAPVAPEAALEYLPRTGYHLFLSSEALARPRMAPFYHRLARQGDIVIMDQPVHERLPVPPLEVILGLCTTIQPTVCVVPDVIGDVDKTVKQFEYYAPMIRAAGVHPMAVVQGRNWSDYIGCIRHYLYYNPDLVWLGIPLIRVFEQIDRAAFINFITREGFFRKHPNLKVHLLGEKNTFDDAIALREHRNVVGVDSAKPVYMALKDIDITDEPGENEWGRPDWYWEVGDRACWEASPLITLNVQNVRRKVASRGQLLSISEEEDDRARKSLRKGRFPRSR